MNILHANHLRLTVLEMLFAAALAVLHGSRPAAAQMAPAAPTNFRAGLLTVTNAQLLWTDNSSTESWFSLEYRDTCVTGTGAPCDPSWSGRVVTANATSYQLTQLRPGSQYQATLQACHGVVCSAVAGLITFALPLIPPMNLAAGRLLPSVALVTWTDGWPFETRFEVAMKWTGYSFWRGEPFATGVDVTWYLRNGLMAGRSYDIRVRACNLVSCSSWVYTTVGP